MSDDGDWFENLVRDDVPLWKKAIYALLIGVVFVLMVVVYVVGVWVIWSPLT